MHRMINGVDSFPLLAVPFFILAGNLMNTAGITNRIYDFAKALVGWMRGGLGQVNIGGSVIFAGMSGTAVADAGGLGTIEIKAMRDHGYDIDFAVGITAASSTIGPIIPPSLPMVIYGVMAGASIGQLFAAGFVPGLLMAVALMIMVAWYARRRNYPRDAAFSLRVLGQTFARAFLALLTPAIIIGGMMFGLFTPDRGRRRRLRLGAVPGRRGLPHARPATAACASASTRSRPRRSSCSSWQRASIFAWILTTTRITEQFAAARAGRSPTEPWLVLLLINLIMLVAGCFLETIAAITILVPVFLPIIEKLGIDPVPVRRHHGAQPDDRPAHPAGRHGALRAEPRVRPAVRALRHRDGAVPGPAPAWCWR